MKLAKPQKTLKTVVFLGSTRTGRLGERVKLFVEKELKKRELVHEVTVMDALELESIFPLLKKPYHFYEAGKAPAELEQWNKVIRDADCYILLSAEYNHAPCPGLINMMDHFASYSFKPSGIVTYSAGPFGGVRAGVALRAFTGEIGCPAVSNTMVFPSVQNLVDETGEISANEQTAKLVNAGIKKFLDQLEWSGLAMKIHRTEHGIPN